MGEWRKVETATPEGATADHTSYDWQFGAEIDGVFVPAVTKSGGYIDALVSAGKQAQADQPAQPTGQGDTQSQPNASTTGGQTFGNEPAGSGQPTGEGQETA